MSRPYPSRSFHSREPLHRRNGKIRAREVRVLDQSRQQLGVMSLDEALRLARNQNLDLVEVAPTATPPVCRIVNYGKFLYEEAKKESHNKQGGSKMKELQLSAVIDPHDFGVKLNQAIRFLCDDMKVRLKLRFRGRQKAHKEVGLEVMNRFVKEAAPYAQADAPPKLMGDRDLSVTLTPLPRQKRAKSPHDSASDEPPAAAEAATAEREE